MERESEFLTTLLDLEHLVFAFTVERRKEETYPGDGSLKRNRIYGVLGRYARENNIPALKVEAPTDRGVARHPAAFYTRESAIQLLALEAESITPSKKDPNRGPNADDVLSARELLMHCSREEFVAKINCVRVMLKYEPLRD